MPSRAQGTMQIWLLAGAPNRTPQPNCLPRHARPGYRAPTRAPVTWRPAFAPVLRLVVVALSSSPPPTPSSGSQPRSPPLSNQNLKRPPSAGRTHAPLPCLPLFPSASRGAERTATATPPPVLANPLRRRFPHDRRFRYTLCSTMRPSKSNAAKPDVSCEIL